MPRRLYDVVALALMVIEHDSEETFNLSHQVPAPYRVEVRRPLFMGQCSVNRMVTFVMRRHGQAIMQIIYGQS